ncbi:MAG: hypothetical protein GYA87_10335, partial [Christensenellaceae bacterium]|nr:hypothetical protein [Christensenellaceae bacterium]
MNNGKIYSQYELSEQLGISPETLQSYIEYLFKKGLISRISMETEQNKCSGRCNNCSGCSMKNTPSNAPV